jgi:hypothetical protein
MRLEIALDNLLNKRNAGNPLVLAIAYFFIDQTRLLEQHIGNLKSSPLRFHQHQQQHREVRSALLWGEPVGSRDDLPTVKVGFFAAQAISTIR